ncbi:MAG TPA: Rieske 2Fe-2S domain-containing protein [Rugosimonospora sp.]|nr:Rieske 2Fe-2S domain-containing protein [Rugosimonospora sp.]
MFAPSWLFLAHTDQFKKSGDFFSTYVGEDPVIVVGKDRKIRAFLNSCQHRGARVGTTRNFTCTHHGWSYDLAGGLISVPNEAGYPPHFDRSDWGLVEVAQIDSYHGLIFGTWNPQAPPLKEALGEMVWYMDAMLDHDEQGTEVVSGVHNGSSKATGNWPPSSSPPTGTTST